ncbi:hypothetical protein [Streptomyces sp. NPDC058735]|uniref:hypothetical protein n=1 Tax=unclassified Streptomyces TaxID=2593676 RepID=UPI003690EBB4
MAGSTNGVGPADAGLSRELPIWFIFNPESEYVPLEGKDDEVDGGSARSPGIDVRCDKVDSYGVPGCVLTQNRARLHPGPSVPIRSSAARRQRAVRPAPGRPEPVRVVRRRPLTTRTRSGEGTAVAEPSPAARA